MDPFPHATRAGAEIAAVRAATRRSRPARRPASPRPGGRARGGPPGPGQGGLPRPRRPQRAHPAWAQLDRLATRRWRRPLDLDLGDIVGAAGTVARTRRGELSVAVDERRRCWRRPSGRRPTSTPGCATPRLRFRQRYLDLIADRGGARPSSRARRRSRRCAASWTTAASSRSRPRCSAALRRRGGAAVRDPPQRARPRPLPADRHRALPEAPDRRRPRAGLRDRQGLPQRGRRATSTTPSSRWSRPTRPTPTTAT